MKTENIHILVGKLKIRLCYIIHDNHHQNKDNSNSCFRFLVLQTRDYPQNMDR